MPGGRTRDTTAGIVFGAALGMVLMLAGSPALSADRNSFSSDVLPPTRPVDLVLEPGPAATTNLEPATGLAPAASSPESSSVAAIAPGVPSDAREVYRRISRAEAQRLDVPFQLVDAVMRVESAFNPLASGAAGEVGLMQIMPPTARLLGHRGTNQDLAIPETNIRLGTTYLAQAWKLAKQDICTTVMKYRAGHNETRFSVLSVRYCERVRTHLASLGYPLTGSVPEPTFGFKADVTRMGIGIGTQAAARRLASGRKLRSRVGWSAHDARMKTLIARGRLSL